MNSLNELNVEMPTMIRTMYDRGRFMSVNGEMWMAVTVPLQPVVDARSNQEREEAFMPLYEALHEISSMTTLLKDTREIARKNYRRIKIMMVDVPQVYHATKENTLKEYLDRSFADQHVSRRLCLLAIKLVDRIGGGGGFKEQIASLADSLAQNSIPLSDYDWDFNRLSSAMARCGLGIPTHEELRLADSWWNQGQFPDVHYLPHADHLHLFRSEGAAVAAETAGREQCEDWPRIPDHSIISIATVDGFEMGTGTLDAHSRSAQWVSQLLLEDIACVSISAFVEPPKVTRSMLRRNRTKFKNDQEEHQKSGKMDRIEAQLTEQQLTSFEDLYATNGGTPSLIETSILVAFNGQVEDMDMINVEIANLRPMASRQRQGFAEMMLGSAVRANPAALDLPIQTVAFSGVQTLNSVGDTKGALLGFTEYDRQPSYIDPTRQSHEDSSPISLNVGGTGSGKRLALSTVIPVPGGYSSMGELQVGDEVYWRGGSTCKVTSVSDIDENPELYRFALSDGQVLKADYEHQWVVSGPAPVAGPEAVQSLIYAASAAEGSLTLEELHELAASMTQGLYRSTEAVRAALAMVDVHIQPGQNIKASTGLSGLALRLSQRVQGNLSLRSDEQMLSTGEIMAEGAEQFRIRAAAPIQRDDSVRTMYSIGLNAGLGLSWAVDQLEPALQKASTTQRLQLVQGLADAAAKVSHSSMYFNLANRYVADAAAELLRSLGIVATEPYQREDLWHVRCDAIATLFTKAEKQVLCTDVLPREQWLNIVEIVPIDPEPARCITVDSPDSTYLVEGFIPTHNTQVLLWKATQYAMAGHDTVIIDPKALALDTVVRTPDGDKTIESIQVGDEVFSRSGVCTVRDKSKIFVDTTVYEFRTEDNQVVVADEHHQWVTRQQGESEYRTLTTAQMLAICADGWELPVPDAVQYPGAEDCNAEDAMVAGVLAYYGEEIPREVMHGTVKARRLALDGMYQVCGTIMGGDVVLFPQEPSNDEAMVDLIRSLGIKTFTDGRSIRFRVAGSIGVERLGEVEPRAEDKVLRIASITQVESRPMQCLSVDSEDHTYLVAGYITTHNTGSDHSPIVKRFGGQVYSLDQIQRADGVFDPIRFSPNKEVGAEIATSMITSIYPWADNGRHNYEVEVQRAISYGVSRGATCTGQALILARNHRIVPPVVVDEVLKLASSSPMFRAIVGMDPNGSAMTIGRGLSLIMVGANHLDLPEPSELASGKKIGINQKVNLALIRMMVFGSAMALTGRDGTLHLDEAWVFLGAGAKEVERLGRLARSQRVLPELYTQKVTDALKADIADYISRGVILHLPEREQAIAACKMFKLEPTEERVRRITAKDLKGAGQYQSVNYESLKALRDPYTHEVKRGSVAIYSDMGGRAIPVEVVLPKSFLSLSSTNARDMDLRDGKTK